MAIKGQRFSLSECDALHDGPIPNSTGPNAGIFGLVGEVRERTLDDAKAPSPPSLRTSQTGFPDHSLPKGKNRKPPKHDHASTSRSKSPNVTAYSEPALDGSIAGVSIDFENKQRLASMFEEEILQNKREIESSLSPSIIETLLKRQGTANQETGLSDYLTEHSSRSSPGKDVRVDELAGTVRGEQSRDNLLKSAATPGEVDQPPLNPPADLHAVSSKQPLPPLASFHFPKPSSPPELDPNDPSFQEKLRSTYFPSLPEDPSSLSWMKSEGEEEASYSRDQDTIPISSVRFDFRGRLIAPRVGLRVPVTKGLHHHGHAPSSAGYTVVELSHLARSTIPSQRCIAFQTLGRLLYRLGRGEFGRKGDDLCDGIWSLIDQGKALQSIIEAASREDEGNRSVWATATDAVVSNC